MTPKTTLFTRLIKCGAALTSVCPPEAAPQGVVVGENRQKTVISAGSMQLIGSMIQKQQCLNFQLIWAEL